MKTRRQGSVGVLLRLPVFRRLWAAIAISSFGDWLGLLATTALAAYLTRDSSSLAQGAAVSGVLLTRLAPDLLLGPVAGALVDRFDRRKVAVVGDTVAGLLYLSIAVVGNLSWLLAAQFLVEAVGLFSTPAKQAMWVNIVPRERLAVANQLNYVSMYGMVPVAAVAFAVLSTVSQFFGAPVAPGADTSTALISGSTSAIAINIALALDACTYFLAAGTVLLSRRMIPAFTGERSSSRSIFSLIGEGISFVSRNRVMRAIYIGILGAFGAGGLVAGVAQAYVATLGAGNAGYGILFGGVFTGLALGMLIGPKVLPTVPRRTLFTSCIGAAGVMLVVMALMGDFVGAVITSAVMGLFAGIAWITGFTMIGHEVSDQLRGRVFAFVMSSVRLTLLATIAVAPVMAGGIGAHLVTVGEFRWLVTGPAIVLAAGGLVAVLVSLFAGHQVGGGAASLALKRVLSRRGSGLLRHTGDHPGILIAVEGADPLLVSRYRESITEHIRSSGYLVTVELDGTGQHPDGIDSAGRGSPSTPAPGAWGRDGDEEPGAALRAVAHLSDMVAGRIRPALESGGVVLCSGYIDAAVVRFGVMGGQDEEQILATALWACDGLEPDLTVLVQPAPAAAVLPPPPVTTERATEPPPEPSTGLRTEQQPEAMPPAQEAVSPHRPRVVVDAGSRSVAVLAGDHGLALMHSGDRADAGSGDQPGADAVVPPLREGSGDAAGGAPGDAPGTGAAVTDAADDRAATGDAAPGATSAAADASLPAPLAAARSGELALAGGDPVGGRAAGADAVGGEPGGGPVDEVAAYRVRAGTAPERYITVHGDPEQSTVQMTLEVAERIDSLLRQRNPKMAEPVGASSSG